MKKFLLMSIMVFVLLSVFAISAFAEDIIVSKTESEEYGTVIQLSADPGLDDAKNYVSTLNKINDGGTDKEALCILTDGTYFYVFPSSYIVNEIKDSKNYGRFDLYAGTEENPGLAQAMAEFNSANGTEYYEAYSINGSGAAKRLDPLVRFEFTSDVTFIHGDYCCLRKYPNLVEVKFNHSVDISKANDLFLYSSKLKKVVGFEKVNSESISTGIFNGCSALESVKLPTDIVRITSSMFRGCGKVRIENLSECTKLTTIGEAAFRDSATLVFTLPDSVTTLEKEAFRAALKSGGSFTINETSQLQTIGVDAFHDCRNLGPTLYIPSTVTSIQSGAFTQAYGLAELANFENCQITELADNTFKSATGLKSIKIPETVTTIGSAFVSTEKLALVYIPKKATSISDAFTGSQPSKAMYIYTGNDTSVFADCTRLAGANVIKASDYDASSSYTGVTLVTDYSHCDVYYNGIHKNNVITPIVTTYLVEIQKISTCVECGFEKSVGTIPALFICDGYSIPEDGRTELVVGFSIKNEAIKEYEALAKKTIEFGAFAALQKNLNDNYIFDENGKTIENAVAAKIEGDKYGMFELKISGFTDEHKNIKLAMGAYVITSVESTETDGDSTEKKTAEYFYLQPSLPNNGDKYHFVSYSDVLNAPEN